MASFLLTLYDFTFHITVMTFYTRDGLDYWLGSTELFSLSKTCPVNIWELDDWGGMTMEFHQWKSYGMWRV